MKKIMAIMLAVIMVMTIVIIPVSAAEADDDGLYAAPVFYGTQKRTNDNGTIDVRFVSVTNSLAGAKLGYEITASWWDATAKEYKERVYSADNGQTVLESNVIYASVAAGEETVTASDIGAKVGMTDARGLFAVAINGVPTSIEVMFSVKTYVKDANNAIVAETEAKEVIYDNGSRSTDKVLQYNNFNDVTLNCTGGDKNGDPATYNAGLAKIGWEIEAYTIFGDQTVTTTADGKLKVSSPTGAAQRGFTVLPAGSISSSSSFTIEMDIAIEFLGSLDIIPGSTYANHRDVVGGTQFRAFSNEERTATLGAGAAQPTASSYLGMQAYKGTVAAPGSNLGLEGNGWGEEFHLVITYDLLNSTYSTYVDGELIMTSGYTGTLDGGICFLQACSSYIIDNLKITATPYVRTEKELYSNNFDDVELDLHHNGNPDAFNEGLKTLGWVIDPYKQFDEATVVSTADGKLKIECPTGGASRGYTILPAGSISSAAESFTIDMDIAIDYLGIIDFVPGSTYASARDSIGCIQFRAYSDEGRTAMMGGGAVQNPEASYLGFQGYKMAGAAASNLGLEGRGWGQEFHLTIKYDLVNKTVTATIDGVQIYTSNYSGTLDGGICFLACCSSYTIDNLVIKAVQ